MVKKFKVDINADIGESFGNYNLGNDSELIKYVSSCNIACGFHAGDPLVMRKTVKLAKRNNVAIGAHPGLPDLMGFGRRKMDAEPKEVRDYIVYQVGALKAFTEAENVKLQHVKLHGALYVMVEYDEALAEAVAKAITEIDPELIFVTEYETIAYKVARKSGLRVVSEGAPDLRYTLNGSPAIERRKIPWNPKIVAKKAVMMVKEGRVQVTKNTYVNVKAETLCIHGDAPNAPDIAKAVKEALNREDIEVISMKGLF